MSTQILHRRGTAAAWALANPILGTGELGFEIDTKIIKMGDGVTPYNSLTVPYLSSGGGTMSGDLDMDGNSVNNLGPMTSTLNMDSNSIDNLGPFLDNLDLDGNSLLNPGAFAGNVSLGNNKVTTLANPTADQDAINRRYADTAFHLTDVSTASSGTTKSTPIPSGAVSLRITATVQFTSDKGNFYVRGNGDSAAASHRSALRQTAEAGGSYDVTRGSDSAILLADEVQNNMFSEVLVDLGTKRFLARTNGNFTSEVNMVNARSGGAHIAAGTLSTLLWTCSGPGVTFNNLKVKTEACFSETPLR